MIRPTASGRSAIVILSARSTTDAQIVRPYRSRIKAKRRRVGTHESVESEGVRCITGYSVVVLTGTDALRLDTSRASLQRGTRMVAYSIVSW